MLSTRHGRRWCWNKPRLIRTSLPGFQRETSYKRQRGRAEWSLILPLLSFVILLRYCFVVIIFVVFLFMVHCGKSLLFDWCRDIISDQDPAGLSSALCHIRDTNRLVFLIESKEPKMFFCCDPPCCVACTGRGHQSSMVPVHVGLADVWVFLDFSACWSFRTVVLENLSK